MKTNRLFKFQNLTIVPSPYSNRCVWAAPKMLRYLLEVYPERLEQYERNLYLLSLYDHKMWLANAIGDRYGQLAFLATINQVLKALTPYPEIIFNFTESKQTVDNINVALASSAPEVLRSPLVRNLNPTKNKHWDWHIRTIEMYVRLNERADASSVSAIITPKFFKVISGPIEFRKFEAIFNWIACGLIPTRHETWVNKHDLMYIKRVSIARSQDLYHKNPIEFNLLNQTARLFMP